MSEKWRESVFRKITNANELKFLDEFLLNKVSCPGASHQPHPDSQRLPQEKAPLCTLRTELSSRQQQSQAIEVAQG